MTTLILVRHGESVANRHDKFVGHTDVELQTRGVEQAKKTAQYIAENYNVDKIYSSDLKRAFKTGQCIGELLGLDVETDKNLREVNGGKWEGYKFTELMELYAEDYNRWRFDIGHAFCTGGETVVQLGNRVMAALTQIAIENDGKTVVITTHATPIRVVQSLIQTGSLETMKDIDWVSNASVSVVEFDNGKWDFVKISEDAHLGDLKTALPKNC